MIPEKSRLAAALVVSCTVLVSASADVRYFVTELGAFPGAQPPSSSPRALNDVGEVTGNSSQPPSYDNHAFHWSQPNGMLDLGTLPGGGNHPNSRGEAINNLGHIAGVSDSGQGHEPLLWTPETGMIGLGVPSGWGTGINDRDQVCGYGGGGAFLWDPAEGLTMLGAFPGGGGTNNYARDINNAGQVVGTSSSAGQAFLWDAQNGMRGLGPFPGGGLATNAYAINEHGQVAGLAVTNIGLQGFFWDPVDGFSGVGHLPTNYFDPKSYAWAVNDHGVVVGMCRIGPGVLDYRGFIWDAQNGIRDLRDLLAAGLRAELTLIDDAVGINNRGQILVNTEAGAGPLLLTPFLVGDMNCDGAVDRFDFRPFYQALHDRNAYRAAYPDCPGEWAADVNQDGAINAADAMALAALVFGRR